MSRLENRVERLEDGRSEEIVVLATAPNDWPEDRREAAAAEAAREHGVDRPDRISLFPCRASECEGVRVLFIGTEAEANAMMKRVLEYIGKYGSMKPRDDDGA